MAEPSEVKARWMWEHFPTGYGPNEWINFVSNHLDAFAATCVAQHTAEMAPLHAEAETVVAQQARNKALEPDDAAIAVMDEAIIKSLNEDKPIGDDWVSPGKRALDALRDHRSLLFALAGCGVG